jgi:uncharacterized membrane protein YbhN (UPF0104 family)
MKPSTDFPSILSRHQLKQLARLRRQLMRMLPLCVSLGCFGASAWAINQELQKHSLTEIWQSVQALPLQAVIIAIGFSCLNYVMLTGYDTLAVRFIRQPVPYRKTAFIAAISYAISNTVGFTLLSGSALRYRFYSALGFSPLAIGKIIVFCNLTFWLGLLAVGGLLFVLHPVAVPSFLGFPFTSVYPIGVIFLSLAMAYLIWNALSHRSLRLGDWVLPHLPFSLALSQIVVTSLDWAFAASILYVLLPPSHSFSYFGFLSIYILAHTAGIVSAVPGGLGVFETVLLLFLSSSVSSAVLLAVFLTYRGIHYFLPLIVAIATLGLYEINAMSTKASK